MMTLFLSGACDLPLKILMNLQIYMVEIAQIYIQSTAKVYCCPFIVHAMSATLIFEI